MRNLASILLRQSSSTLSIAEWKKRGVASASVLPISTSQPVFDVAKAVERVPALRPSDAFGRLEATPLRIDRLPRTMTSLTCMYDTDFDTGSLSPHTITLECRDDRTSTAELNHDRSFEMSSVSGGSNILSIAGSGSYPEPSKSAGQTVPASAGLVTISMTIPGTPG